MGGKEKYFHEKSEEKDHSSCEQILPKMFDQSLNSLKSSILSHLVSLQINWIHQLPSFPIVTGLFPAFSPQQNQDQAVREAWSSSAFEREETPAKRREEWQRLRRSLLQSWEQRACLSPSKPSGLFQVFVIIQNLIPQLYCLIIYCKFPRWFAVFFNVSKWIKMKVLCRGELFIPLSVLPPLQNSFKGPMKWLWRF